MPANPRLEHVRFVKGRVAGIPKLYAYFDTGKRKPNGRPVYVPMPPFGTTGFYDSYAAMRGARTKRETAAYTVASLIDDYQRSPDFGALAHRSQIVYGTALRKIADTLGFIPATALERKHVQTVLDGEDFGAGTHNNYIAVLSALYTWARGRDKASQKPCEGLSKRKGGEHEPWPEDVLEAALVASDDRVRLATRLLYCTGQRIGDVLRMRWSDIRDNVIEVTQQKTGKTVWIPFLAELREELERTPKKGLTIIANDRGQRRGDHAVRLELQAFTRALASAKHRRLPPCLRPCSNACPNSSRARRPRRHCSTHWSASHSTGSTTAIPMKWRSASPNTKLANRAQLKPKSAMASDPSMTAQPLPSNPGMASAAILKLETKRGERREAK